MYGYSPGLIEDKNEFSGDLSLDDAERSWAGGRIRSLLDIHAYPHQVI
jgi:hypothetical protein